MPVTAERIQEETEIAPNSPEELDTIELPKPEEDEYALYCERLETYIKHKDNQEKEVNKFLTAFSTIFLALASTLYNISNKDAWCSSVLLMISAVMFISTIAVTFSASFFSFTLTGEMFKKLKSFWEKNKQLPSQNTAEGRAYEEDISFFKKWISRFNVASFVSFTLGFFLLACAFVANFCERSSP